MAAADIATIILSFITIAGAIWGMRNQGLGDEFSPGPAEGRMDVWIQKLTFVSTSFFEIILPGRRLLPQIRPKHIADFMDFVRKNFFKKPSSLWIQK